MLWSSVADKDAVVMVSVDSDISPEPVLILTSG